jgi:hypothetical protein
MWTIFNSEGKTVGNCNFEPNHADLLTRGERACFHDEPIALPEALLDDGAVKRKPLVTLAATVVDSVATVTVACEDGSIAEIPLVIAGVAVTKPPGTLVIYGEPGIKLGIDFDRTRLRGKGLEVCF